MDRFPWPFNPCCCGASCRPCQWNGVFRTEGKNPAREVKLTESQVKIMPCVSLQFTENIGDISLREIANAGQRYLRKKAVFGKSSKTSFSRLPSILRIAVSAFSEPVLPNAFAIIVFVRSECI